MNRTVVAGVVAVVLFGGRHAAGSGLGDMAAREVARRNPPISSCRSSAKPVLRWSPVPEYSRLGVPPGVGGTVEFDLVIGVDGRVKRADVADKDVDARLVASAREAVLERRYCPAFSGGEPIESKLSVRISYVSHPTEP